MSTKCTLASGDNFHLYQEMSDRECKLRLTLAGPLADFSVAVVPPGDGTSGCCRVTVAIPREVWDRIRGIAGEARSWGWDEDGATAE